MCGAFYNKDAALGQLSEFEHDNNTDSQQESSTDSHSARHKAQAAPAPCRRGAEAVCVLRLTTKTRHLNRLGLLSEFEQASSTDSHSARDQSQVARHGAAGALKPCVRPPCAAAEQPSCRAIAWWCGGLSTGAAAAW